MKSHIKEKFEKIRIFFERHPFLEGMFLLTFSIVVALIIFRILQHSFYWVLEKTNQLHKNETILEWNLRVIEENPWITNILNAVIGITFLYMFLSLIIKSIIEFNRIEKEHGKK